MTQNRHFFTTAAWLREHFGDNALKSLFTSESVNHATVLHFMCDSENVFLGEVFQLLRDIFSREEIKTLIFTKGSRGFTTLGYFSLGRMYGSARNFWKILKTVLTAEELEQLVLERNNNGQNVLMYGEGRKAKAVDELRKLFIESYGAEKLKNIM